MATATRTSWLLWSCLTKKTLSLSPPSMVAVALLRSSARTSRWGTCPASPTPGIAPTVPWRMFQILILQLSSWTSTSGQLKIVTKAKLFDYKKSRWNFPLQDAWCSWVICCCIINDLEIANWDACLKVSSSLAFCYILSQTTQKYPLGSVSLQPPIGTTQTFTFIDPALHIPRLMLHLTLCLTLDLYWNRTHSHVFVIGTGWTCL